MQGFNFTERARKVLDLARREAARRNHPFVGTEHILLALLDDGDGIAVTALQNLNVNLESIQQTVDQIITNGTEKVSSAYDLPFTTRAKKALELSMHEAQNLDHQYVGTEHILLGLICEETGIAAQVLRHNTGLTEEKARAEVRRLIDGPLEE